MFIVPDAHLRETVSCTPDDDTPIDMIFKKYSLCASPSILRAVDYERRLHPGGSLSKNDQVITHKINNLRGLTLSTECPSRLS